MLLVEKSSQVSLHPLPEQAPEDSAWPDNIIFQRSVCALVNWASVSESEFAILETGHGAQKGIASA